MQLSSVQRLIAADGDVRIAEPLLMWNFLRPITGMMNMAEAEQVIDRTARSIGLVALLLAIIGIAIQSQLDHPSSDGSYFRSQQWAFQERDNSYFRNRLELHDTQIQQLANDQGN
jgi:hypothetical protein